MKWRKLGQVFDFASTDFGADFIGFAQSPQAIEFDDHVRFYFSTRQRSDNGKFVSVVQYVDMDKQFKTILGRSRGVVVPLGKLGTFDEHGIFPFSVFRHAGAIWGYSNGWNRRKSVSVDTAIGLATSEDGGDTFVKLGDGPVLGPSLHEPCLVCDPFVRVFDGVFHMWYIYGTGWKSAAPGQEPDRTYVIAHATSSDGVSWTKEGRPIISQTHSDECQALPTVIQLGTRYHMVFCHRHTFDFRTNPARAYRLGYAWSDDLVTWTRDDAAVGIATTPGAWDADMMCYPHLFTCAGKTYLAYNGNEFGRAGFGVAELESVD
jgi:sucrose-6-phosphate hydrolase SacC (GH32 family)